MADWGEEHPAEHDFRRPESVIRHAPKLCRFKDNAEIPKGWYSRRNERVWPFRPWQGPERGADIAFRLDDSSHHSYAQFAETAVKFWMISRVSPCDLSVKRSICCIGKNFVLALYPRFASSVRVVLKKANLLKNRDAKFPV